MNFKGAFDNKDIKVLYITLYKEFVDLIDSDGQFVQSIFEIKNNGIYRLILSKDKIIKYDIPVDENGRIKILN